MWKSLKGMNIYQGTSKAPANNHGHLNILLGEANLEKYPANKSNNWRTKVNIFFCAYCEVNPDHYFYTERSATHTCVGMWLFQTAHRSVPAATGWKCFVFLFSSDLGVVRGIMCINMILVKKLIYSLTNELWSSALRLQIRL